MINEKYLKEIRTYIQRKTGKYYFKTIRTTTENLVVTCPFHKGGQENKPSANISTISNETVSEGLFHCFTCGKSMMLSQVLEDLLGDLYNEDEVESLFNLSTLVLQSSFQEYKETIKFTIPKELTYETSLLKNYDYYHEYLLKRGINEDTAKKYCLGYDSSNKQITFPIRDINRYCVGIGRRSVDNKFYSYPQDFVKPLYRCI